MNIFAHEKGTSATGEELEISGNTVKLVAADFASESISVVSNAGGYQFELENDASGKTFLDSKDNDSFSNFADSASVNCAACNDEILSTDLVNRHTDATSFMLEGLSTETGVTIEGSKVILSAAALENVDEVTLTSPDDYTLAMGEDVTQTSTNPEGWYLSETTATYKTKENLAGYELTGNQISYVAASVGEEISDATALPTAGTISLPSGSTLQIVNGYTISSESDGGTITFGETETALSNAAVNITGAPENTVFVLENSSAKIDGLHETFTLGGAFTVDATDGIIFEIDSTGKVAAVENLDADAILKISGGEEIPAAS